MKSAIKDGVEAAAKTLMMRDAQIHDQGDGPHTVCKIGQLDVSTRLRATCEDLTLAVVLKSSASCSKVQSCAFLAPQHPSERYTCSHGHPGHPA
jgi:hypothetical protein